MLFWEFFSIYIPKKYSGLKFLNDYSGAWENYYNGKNNGAQDK